MNTERNLSYEVTHTNCYTDLHLYGFDKSQFKTFADAYTSGVDKAYWTTNESLEMMDFTERRDGLWEVQDLVYTLINACGGKEPSTGLVFTRTNSDEAYFVSLDVVVELANTFTDLLTFDAVYSFCCLAVDNADIAKKVLDNEHIEVSRYMKAKNN
ncbi:hypothetical protein [Vibrio sp. 10N.239.312.D08]|uniref:hypothetical protein n=1 Tax=Vibrio sp. 10N.239.312.D08 TaxID=3229978 RepID=UPI00354C0E9B